MQWEGTGTPPTCNLLDEFNQSLKMAKETQTQK